MRFNNIDTFNIEDLSLDEGNYRFKKADNQEECIAKIYKANTEYFKGLMASIAEDDLGEPLLVLQSEDNNLVVDGNRRLSALKVLYHDKYAPSETLKRFAGDLREKHELNFNEIQAQVSDDQKLVSKTIFERHSSEAKGTSRIPWSAYAAARFGFDEKIGDNKEWKIMSLLAATEIKYPQMTAFLDSSEFSYDVFRRIIRSALSNQIISDNIFSVSGENIKKNASKKLTIDALSKTHNILKKMKEKVITLSRKEGLYADKSNVDAFVIEFGLSPDNQKIADAKKASKGTDTSEEQTSNNSKNEENKTDGSSASGTKLDVEIEVESEENDNTKGIAGIDESNEIRQKLKDLKSQKLTSLYKSLCVVSLSKHGALTYVGAWSFFEVLGRTMGNQTSEFPAYFKNRYQALDIDRTTGKDYSHALDDISKYGNAAKHSKNLMPMNGIQLRNHFEVLEPLIIKALDLCIAEGNE